MEVKFKKEPHAQQQKFIDSDEPEQLYGGAKRGGKTIALCQKSTLLNVMFPGNRGLLCRYNFTDLQDTTLAEFFETVPSDLILGHHKGDRTIFLRTVDPRSAQRSTGTKDGYSPFASRQLYRGLGDPEEFEKVKGLSLGHFEIDEPSEVPFPQYLMLRAQLTWQLPNGDRPPYMCLLASNPEPGWVEDRFITNLNKGCVFIPSLPRDNPHLPPGYEADLRANFPGDWVTKYLDGVWGASEGAIFKELDPKIHDLDNWMNPEGPDWFKFCWPLNLVMSIDHASTGVVAMVLIGIDQYGNHYALDEYYEKDRLISQHCLEMHGKLDHYTEYWYNGNKLGKELEYMLIDPATCQRTLQGQEKLQAVADAYRDEGFPCVPAWNAIELGLSRIKEHMHISPLHRHPFTGLYGSPSLFISRTRCPNLWEEIRKYKKKIRSNGYVEYVGSDHALDDLRYLILSRPRRPEMEKLEEKGLDPLTLIKVRSEDRWAKTFVRGTSTHGRKNSAFGGMGFN